MAQDWPFEQPPNLAVITLERILHGKQAILYVSHDADDGGWQFLDDEEVYEGGAMVVGLKTVLEFDSTITELADLPEGWIAWRSDIKQQWQREPAEEPDDED